MNVELRVIRATAGHANLIAPLFDAYRQFYKQAPDLPAALAYLTERLASEESVIFLALSGDEAAGFTQLYPSFSSVSLNRLWILNDLFVEPAARGRGVGEALLARAREFAIETESKGLVLETAADNPAQRLYERLGWIRDRDYLHYYLRV